MQFTALQFPLFLTEPFFRQLALSNFFLQFLVGCSKFRGSLRNPPIEFIGDPLLFPQQPCLSQPD